MLKLLNYTDSNNLMWQAPFSFSLLILLADNNWFDFPWGCYLKNLATLVYTTFELSKQPTFS